MADARLADGSRVNVVIPPLAVDGPALSVRRFSARRPGPDELVAGGTLTPEVRDLLAEAVAARRSVLVSGGTGSGKTTLLNALSAWIDPAERVVTIEDAAELRLRQPHVVRLESRPASIEGRGEVTIRDLLRNALRMRPDRIVIGEVRGAGGARPADRAQHRPRRRALDRARELARRRPAARRDAGADGRRRPAARGDPRAARPRPRPDRPHGSRRRRRPARDRGGGGAARGRRGRRCASSGGASERARRRSASRWPPARAGSRPWPSARRRWRRPGAARWLGDALEPLRRAGREGHVPTELERRRLAVLGTLAILAVERGRARTRARRR